MTLSPELQQMREAAEKATPGPWEYEINEFRISIQECREPRDEDEDTTIAGIWGDTVACEPTAKFIALANPQAILDLLAAYEKTLERVRELELSRDYYAGQIGKPL